MKLTINTDDHCTEAEITITCNRISDDIEKLLAAIRLLDLKLIGHKNGQRCILDAADVIYIESTDKRTFIYTFTDVYESPLRLYELETRLANNDFLRASRNCIFNINHIEAIEPDLDRRLILTMTKEIKLVVSRQYSPEIKQRLEAYHG